MFVAKKHSRSKRELRSLRAQQLVFIAIGVMIILSMLISLVR